MKHVFLEADQLAQFHGPHGVHETWQCHGMGLLVTMAHQAGYQMDVLTLKAMHSWAELRMLLKGYDVLAMNVRSWRYIYAKRAAEIFKLVNPRGQVWVGGMHATVAAQEMAAVEAFDVIVSRRAEGTWLELLRNGGSADRIVQGHCTGFENMDNLPWINRERAWPRTGTDIWPLEGSGGWGPGKRALTQITGFRCPFACSFCFPAEKNHFGPPARRSVEHVIGEMEQARDRWGEFGTVVFHDSEFLMHKSWLERFVEDWPRANGPAFWASCRADMMAKWPGLFTRLVKEAGWHTVSIGLESGSQRILDLMNKETTVEQNNAAIDLVNSLGDQMAGRGERPPVIFANVMLATPGEEPEDAFETVRMLGRIKRCLPSISWFTPYPGSTLGDQIITEGRSLDTYKRYLRFPNEAKVAGVDYQFYLDLANGRYDAETGVNMRELMSRQGSAVEALV